MAATPTMPDDDVIERMARRIHEAYREANATQDSSHPAMAEWDELDARLRAQNRDQARHLVVVFHEVGFELVEAPPGTPHVPGEAEIPAELIDRLARHEHDRWVRAKEAQGYEWGPERHDGPGPLTHPDLCAWEELDASTRAKDRRPLLDFPAVCASVGLEFRRR